jgi:hypothetical protein
MLIKVQAIFTKGQLKTSTEQSFDMSAWREMYKYELAVWNLPGYLRKNVIVCSRGKRELAAAVA